MTSDPDGADFTDTTYDTLGHVSTVSNLHRASALPTDGTTTTFYDALGRTCLVVPPDGTLPSGNACPATQPANTISTSYSGNCSIVTDQAGKSRKSCSDALGRLTQVFEDPAGLNYETDYTYDALDNLLTVSQKGGTSDSTKWRTRTFTYDSLSRLLTASNPESGTISYAYDANGHVLTKTSPAPNQAGTATATVSYCYDALNRLTAKAYTFSPNAPPSCSGTPPTFPSPVATYSYDQSTANGLTIANGIGRRTSMIDQAGSEVWSYDSMGRVAADKRTTSGVTETYSYTYNLDGSQNTIAHPDGLVVTFQQGGAGRPLTESSIDASYAYNAHYAPNGALCYWQQNWGSATTANRTFNNRFQITRVWENSPNPPAYPDLTTPCTIPPNPADLPVDFSYIYADASGHNNGNVLSITSNADGSRTQYFTYDSLNRISSAFSAATNQPAFQGDTSSIQRCWGEQYSYDPWGNLLSIQGIQPTYTGCTQEPGFDYSSLTSAKNQITASGFTYDAAGNLVTSPGPGTVIYDAENRLTYSQGQTYLYDGDGKRVEKATGSPLAPVKLYWYGTDDSPVLETDGAGNELDRYFRFEGIVVTREEANDWVDHYGVDALGNVRWVYGTNGTWDISDYYPFGGQRVIASGTTNSRLFTGKERDPESNLDNFGARYNSSSLGRFMSPDEPLLDQEARDPQSWNLYSYVRNNPLNNTDPSGNACVSNGRGGFVDDNSGGQSCKDAQEPQKVRVNAQAGSGISSFFLNFFFKVNSAANDFFRPITNLIGIQPSYMQNIPTGSGAGATAGVGVAAAATFFIGPEAEGINITVDGLEHVLTNHTIGGAVAALGEKSIFNAGEDVQGLIKAAEGVSPIRQATGNFERVVDAGRTVGIDRTTGAPTSTYTVITKPNGNLVTAFPGKP